MLILREGRVKGCRDEGGASAAPTRTGIGRKAGQAPPPGGPTLLALDLDGDIVTVND